MDMTFAASPTGSIGSRLPPISDEAKLDDEAKNTDLSKLWRYSIAPDVLLGFDRDVREPVPGASPAESHDEGKEPLSSGFNSPNLPVHVALDGTVDLGSSPPALPDSPLVDADHDLQLSRIQGKLSELRVASEERSVAMELDDSPLVAHVRKMSADAQPPLDISEDSIVSEPSDGEIFLSEPAKAAAASAKEKRGVLRSLFGFHRTVHEVPDEDSTQQDQHSRIETPCPDPQMHNQDHQQNLATPCPDPELHELFTRSACPDPGAHLASHLRALSNTTPDDMVADRHQSMNLDAMADAFHGPLQPPMAPFSRASSTGSPLPIPRFKSPPSSAHRMSEQYPQAYHGGRQPYHGESHRQVRHKPSFPHEASEHFRPGWYYTQSQPPSMQSGRRNEYSFSTAAAKVVGRSAAPDSLIRDSYRTDTLTPLARPIGKYRKTGIAAIASARGVSKYYGEHSGRRPSNHQTRTGTRRPRYHPDVRFRSSPPPQPLDMGAEPYKRQRPRDLDDEIYRDDISHATGTDLDEETRAAIRLSLLAAEASGPNHAGHGQPLRELSPNVMTCRGTDRRQRKKRRPSYWDGDLKEVQASPARRDMEGKIIRGSVREGAERKVLTSPPKEGVESVRSERVEIEGQENVSEHSTSARASAGICMGNEGVVLASGDEMDGTMMQIEREMD